MCVNNLPRVALDSREARIRTRKFTTLERLNIDLRRGKLEFLEPGEVSILEQQDVFSLARQQVLEGEDQLEVGGGRHVVVTSQRVVVALGHETHALVELFAHRDRLRAHFVLQVHVFQELVGHHLQRVLRPSLIPGTHRRNQFLWSSKINFPDFSR